jgi:hypothetical protein
MIERVHRESGGGCKKRDEEKKSAMHHSKTGCQYEAIPTKRIYPKSVSVYYPKQPIKRKY